MPDPSSVPSLIEWALRYVRNGWPVMPLRGKVPLTPNGSKDATLSEDQVRAWWAQWPQANIGLATGLRFFVLDIDIKDGGEDSFSYLLNQHGALPPTLQQTTGTGGQHLLFRMPDFPVRNSAGMLAPGIDIRGIGGYIVAAPSIHPETKRAYDWDGLQEPEILIQGPIADAPAWLLDKLRAGLNTKVPAGKPAPTTITEGSRNSQMFKLAASLRRKGLSEEEILATLRVSNTLRCVPPLPSEELQTIAKSAARYTPDAKQVFARENVAPPQSDGADTNLPLTGADVEAAVDDAITRKSMTDVMRMAPEIARLKLHVQAVIIAKLRAGFGAEYVELSKWFEKALKDAAPDKGSAGGSEPPQNPPAGNGDYPNLLGFPLTDSGNGERIVALFGADIRYCVEMKTWFVWDGTRWARDDAGEMRQKGKLMARILYLQAVNRSAVVEKHARASESYAGISAALGSAATEKGIPITANELDQQPFILNCPNGAIDLRTGALLPPDRAFLITKLCPVTYSATAECPRFLAFIEWAMGANPDADLTDHTVRLVGFLQRAFGYSLTADVGEKQLFVFYGKTGNNGKTTLLKLFRDLLGKDYAGRLLIETVMAMKSADATARADLADLRGARLAVTSEVNKGQGLNEAMIKQITAGDDTIKSCRKYENPIEFPATHKLFMDCNDRPKVRGGGDAIWSRLKCVPFEVRIADEDLDTALPEKLRTEVQGILAWAVRGCLAWQKGGLGEPPEVTDAGDSWREDDDPLKEFLEDCCTLDDGSNPDGELFVRSPELAAGYEFWAKQNREKFPLGREAFRERLLAKGFRYRRTRMIEGKQARTWEGLQLNIDVVKAMRHEKPWDKQGPLTAD